MIPLGGSNQAQKHMSLKRHSEYLLVSEENSSMNPAGTGDWQNHEKAWKKWS
jgi:hypothetical protein